MSVIEAGLGSRGADSGSMRAAEETLDEIVAKRTHLSPGDYRELSRLIDKLTLRIARLPRTQSTDPFNTMSRQLQLRLCVWEIEQTIARLRDGIDQGMAPAELPDEGHGPPEPFDSSAALHQILDLEETNAANNRTSFERSISPSIMMPTHASACFRQAMRNVINNAIKYSGRLRSGNTWIKVMHKEQDGYSITAVENWGPAIRANDIPKIFEHGTRGTQPSRMGQGRGLAIALNCITELNGTIRAKSLPTKNNYATTTFTIRIPVV